MVQSSVTSVRLQISISCPFRVDNSNSFCLQYPLASSHVLLSLTYIYWFPFTLHIHPVNRKTTSLKIISSLTLKSHISSQNTGLKNTLKSGRNAVQLGLSANADNQIQSCETISSVYFIITPSSVDVVTDNTLWIISFEFRFFYYQKIFPYFYKKSVCVQDLNDHL